MILHLILSLILTVCVGAQAEMRQAFEERDQSAPAQRATRTESVVGFVDPRAHAEYREQAAAFCSGVVVAPKLVLTAAHCVMALSKDWFSVKSGCRLNNSILGVRAQKAPTKFARIKSVWVHPRLLGLVSWWEWNAFLNKPDLALIEFVEDLQLPMARVASLRENSLRKGVSIHMRGFGSPSPTLGADEVVRDYSLMGFITELREHQFSFVLRGFMGQSEHLLRGDSGGGVFIETAQGLKLVGINSAVLNKNPISERNDSFRPQTFTSFATYVSREKLKAWLRETKENPSSLCFNEH